jgi:hypothetical protein
MPLIPLTHARVPPRLLLSPCSPLDPYTAHAAHIMPLIPHTHIHTHTLVHVTPQLLPWPLQPFLHIHCTRCTCHASYTSHTHTHTHKHTHTRTHTNTHTHLCTCRLGFCLGLPQQLLQLLHLASLAGSRLCCYSMSAGNGSQRLQACTQSKQLCFVGHLRLCCYSLSAGKIKITCACTSLLLDLSSIIP